MYNNIFLLIPPWMWWSFNIFVFWVLCKTTLTWKPIIHPRKKINRFWTTLSCCWTSSRTLWHKIMKLHIHTLHKNKNNSYWTCLLVKNDSYYKNIVLNNTTLIIVILLCWCPRLLNSTKEKNLAHIPCFGLRSIESKL